MDLMHPGAMILTVPFHDIYDVRTLLRSPITSILIYRKWDIQYERERTSQPRGTKEWSGRWLATQGTPARCRCRTFWHGHSRGVAFTNDIIQLIPASILWNK